MKRLKQMYPEITKFEHLYQAHRLARRVKRSKEEVIRFELDLNRNLMMLQEQLQARTYRPGLYREFKVYVRCDYTCGLQVSKKMLTD